MGNRECSNVLLCRMRDDPFDSVQGKVLPAANGTLPPPDNAAGIERMQSSKPSALPMGRPLPTWGDVRPAP